MVENADKKMSRTWWAIGCAMVFAFGIVMPAAAAHGEGGISAQIQELRDFVEAQFGANAQDHADLEAQLAGLGEAPAVFDVMALASPAFAQPGASPVYADPLDAGFTGYNHANILVRVTHMGAGVSGLPPEAFTIATRLVPAGQCALEIDEVSTFGSPMGDYALSVTPIDHPFGSPEQTDVCHWDVGMYGSTLEVAWDGKIGSTLIGFDVE